MLGGHFSHFHFLRVVPCLAQIGQTFGAQNFLLSSHLKHKKTHFIVHIEVDHPESRNQNKEKRVAEIEKRVAGIFVSLFREWDLGCIFSILCCL